MPRIRTVKPEFWQNEELAEVHAETALMAIGLLNLADDEGYFKANPSLIQAAIFPIRKLSTTVRRSIDDLSRIGYIEVWTGVDGKEYGRVVKFGEHQKIDRSKPSKIKDIERIDDASTINRRRIGDQSTPERKGKERKGKECKGTESATADRLSIFVSWWLKYPRKIKKPQSQKAFLKMTDADIELATGPAYDAWLTHWETIEDQQFIPHPLTWLNGSYWESDPPRSTKSSQNHAGSSAMPETYHKDDLKFQSDPQWDEYYDHVMSLPPGEAPRFEKWRDQ